MPAMAIPKSLHEFATCGGRQGRVVGPIDALGDSIRDYDFEAAAAKLDKIVQEINLNA
jgi:hypothetical protein